MICLRILLQSRTTELYLWCLLYKVLTFFSEQLVYVCLRWALWCLALDPLHATPSQGEATFIYTVDLSPLKTPGLLLFSGWYTVFSPSSVGGVLRNDSAVTLVFYSVFLFSLYFYWKAWWLGSTPLVESPQICACAVRGVWCGSLDCVILAGRLILIRNSMLMRMEDGVFRASKSG